MDGAAKSQSRLLAPPWRNPETQTLPRLWLHRRFEKEERNALARLEVVGELAKAVLNLSDRRIDQVRRTKRLLGERGSGNSNAQMITASA